MQPQEKPQVRTARQASASEFQMHKKDGQNKIVEVLDHSLCSDQELVHNLIPNLHSGMELLGEMIPVKGIFPHMLAIFWITIVFLVLDQKCHLSNFKVKLGINL